MNLEYPPFGDVIHCTHVAGRKPEWKLHRDRGKAINAIMMNYRGGQLWTFDFDIGKWEIVYNAPPEIFMAKNTSRYPFNHGGYMLKDNLVGRMRHSKATLELCLYHDVKVVQKDPYGDYEFLRDEEMLRRLT